MLKSKETLVSVSVYLHTLCISPTYEIKKIVEDRKDKIVGDIMFGILDVYEDLVEDAFIIIQLFNLLNCISNKKLIILSFIEILKKDSSLKHEILEEINFLAVKNSLEDWQFLKDAIKEINDKFSG